MTDKNQIPKIIHQLWIGPKSPPSELMETWRKTHESLGWEYRLWNEQTIQSNIDLSRSGRLINSMEEINGKADIIRWEILFKYGGIFIDADSICINPIDDNLLKDKAGNFITGFAGWEHEQARKGLIATGTMGFTPKHPIVIGALAWMYKQPTLSVQATQKRAWFTVGPGLLTRICNEHNFNNIVIYPSYYFLPIHYTGITYTGHAKVYAFQEWGSTNESYDTMTTSNLPAILSPPIIQEYNCCSVLVSSYNTQINLIKECLESIRQQVGHFAIEIIWINDGSTEENTKLLKQLLDHFQTTCRFVRLRYFENNGNKGIGYSLNLGVKLCSYDLIIKMDSDDIMVPDRIEKQLRFMRENPDCMICGGQINMFREINGDKKFISKTSHPTITWEEYKTNPSNWFVNHPTLCYRKKAILETGNYNPNIHSMVEDFHLEIRMLKKFGKISNIPDVVLNYRLHDKQVTVERSDPKWQEERNTIISSLIKTS